MTVTVTLTFADVAAAAEGLALLNAQPAPSPVVAPLPVPAPTVATAPPSMPLDEDSAPASATPPDRDAEGLPWDARIHSESRALTADGKWRRKRGTADTYWNEVRAQLQGAVAAPPAAVPVPPVPPAAEVPVPPAAEVPVPTNEFPALMMHLAPMLASDPTGTNARVATALATVGLTMLPQLAARPDLVPQFRAIFDAMQS